MKKLSVIVSTCLFFLCCFSPGVSADEGSSEWINPVWRHLAPEKSISRFQSLKPMGSVPSCTSYAAFRSELRQKLENREAAFTINLLYDFSRNEIGDIITAAFKDIFAADGYIQGNVFSRGMSWLGGDGNADIDFTMTYWTTYDQEQQVTTRVAEILDEIITGTMNEAEKIRAVHDWVVLNVAYDQTTAKHSAYDALFGDRETVCQGYALLVIRLLQDLSIPSRFVSGDANNGSGWGAHAWNLVFACGNWYHVDATWDDPIISPPDPDYIRWDYYLMSDSFMSDDHRWETADYPEAPTDFTVCNTFGDVSGDGNINLNDLILALKVCADLEIHASINKAGDVNGDGRIGIEEAMFILSHIAEFDRASEGLIKSSVSYNSAPAYSPSDLDTLVDGFSDFTIDFYHALRNQDASKGKNLFFSTYSIENALAMTWAGAKNHTGDEMAAVLHYNLPRERFHPTLNALNIDINSRDDQPPFDGDPFHLNVVNAVWSRIGYPFLTAYLDVMAENYDAGVRTLDFKQNPDGSRRVINQWVEDQTFEKIKDLLPANSITPDTAVVLTNAVYFKGSWYSKFEERSTVPGDFTRLDQTVVTADMMHQQLDTKYAQNEAFDAVKLPYVSPRYTEDQYPEELSMLVIIPKAGFFASVEAGLDDNTMGTIVASLSMGDVVLTLPKFEFEAEVKCKALLQQMGLRDAFDPVVADFSGMVSPNDSRPYIDEIYHKAFVGVDEAGTEAAAATAVVMCDTTAEPDPVIISADRPFIFLIRDNITDVILFMGRVLDPAS